MNADIQATTAEDDCGESMRAVRQNLPGALDAKCSVWAVEDRFGHAEITASAGPFLAKWIDESGLAGSTFEPTAATAITVTSNS